MARKATFDQIKTQYRIEPTGNPAIPYKLIGKGKGELFLMRQQDKDGLKNGSPLWVVDGTGSGRRIKNLKVDDGFGGVQSGSVEWVTDPGGEAESDIAERDERDERRKFIGARYEGDEPLAPASIKGFSGQTVKDAEEYARSVEGIIERRRDVKEMSIDGETMSYGKALRYAGSVIDEAEDKRHAAQNPVEEPETKIDVLDYDEYLTRSNEPIAKQYFDTRSARDQLIEDINTLNRKEKQAVYAWSGPITDTYADDLPKPPRDAVDYWNRIIGGGAFKKKEDVPGWGNAKGIQSVERIDKTLKAAKVHHEAYESGLEMMRLAAHRTRTMHPDPIDENDQLVPLAEGLSTRVSWETMNDADPANRREMAVGLFNSIESDRREVDRFNRERPYEHVRKGSVFLRELTGRLETAARVSGDPGWKRMADVATNNAGVAREDERDQSRRMAEATESLEAQRKAGWVTPDGLPQPAATEAPTSTRRERQEQRVDRAEVRVEKLQEKVAQRREGMSPYTDDYAFMTQPIQGAQHRKVRRGLKSEQKDVQEIAATNAKIDGMRNSLARNIYGDDPERMERFQTKIKAERREIARVKASNTKLRQLLKSNPELKNPSFPPSSEALKELGFTDAETSGLIRSSKLSVKGIRSFPITKRTNRIRQMQGFIKRIKADQAREQDAAIENAQAEEETYDLKQEVVGDARTSTPIEYIQATDPGPITPELVGDEWRASQGLPIAPKREPKRDPIISSNRNGVYEWGDYDVEKVYRVEHNATTEGKTRIDEYAFDMEGNETKGPSDPLGWINKHSSQWYFQSYADQFTGQTTMGPFSSRKQAVNDSIAERIVQLKGLDRESNSRIGGPGKIVSSEEWKADRAAKRESEAAQAAASAAVPDSKVVLGEDLPAGPQLITEMQPSDVFTDTEFMRLAESASENPNNQLASIELAEHILKRWESEGKPTHVQVGPNVDVRVRHGTSDWWEQGQLDDYPGEAVSQGDVAIDEYKKVRDTFKCFARRRTRV